MTIYQVLPRLFKSGKFSSWNDESFDYLHSLSIDAIWYTGIIRHASGQEWVKGDPGCPYAISDYFDVNPYLADNPDNRMQEFEDLVRRTHKAGFKVIIDLVPNHVAKCGASGIPTYSWCDYDWTDTLKIDYSSMEAWHKMKQVVEFWIGKGVDGMRCDMVELVDIEFLSWIISQIKSSHPDFVFIGEVYNRQNYERFTLDVGFDLLYDKSGLYDSLRAITCSGMTARAITWNWQSLGDLQGRMLNFLENHDEQRIASRAFAGSARKAYASLAADLLFNDASFLLYFGQECGESAPEDENGRTSIFNITEVRSLQNPDAEVLARYKEILALAATPLFRQGRNWDLCYCNQISKGFNADRHFAFLRILDGSCAAALICNFSDTPADIDLFIPEETGLKISQIPDVKIPAWDFVKIDLSL